jgi:hypothetical protein
MYDSSVTSSYWVAFCEVRAKAGETSQYQAYVSRERTGSLQVKGLAYYTHRGARVPTGDTFKDLPRLRETTDNTERYI